MDTRTFDLTVLSYVFTWKKVEAKNPLSLWSARNGHAVVAFDDKIWVMGGYDVNNNFDDVWRSSDGASWIKATDTPGWAGRYRHAAVVFNEKMWVMGGHYLTPKNDVWWSSDGTAWTKLTNGTPHWSGRWGHTVVTLGEKMFLFGGNDENNKNDVWVYQQTN